MLNVTYGDKAGSITYCPLTYCYNALSGSYPEGLQDVCKALYIYSVEAADFMSAG